MKCCSCEREITKSDEYIKYNDDRYCDDCFVRDVTISYFVGGGLLGTDSDGVKEYGWLEGQEEG